VKSAFKYIQEIFYLLGKRRTKLFVMLLLFLISSLLDLVGLSLIGAYMALLVEPESMSSNYISDFFENFGVLLNFQELILYVGLGLIAIFFFKFLFSLFITATISRFSLNTIVFLRIRSVETIQKMPYLDLISRNSSEFIQAINAHVSEFTNVLRESLLLISNTVVSIAILAFLAFTSPYAMLVLVGLLSLLYFGHSRLLASRLEEYGKLSVEGGVLTTKAFIEGLKGMKDLTILGTGNLFRDRILQASKLVVINQFKKEVINFMPKYVLEFFLIFFLVSLILTSFYINQNLNELVAVIGIFAVASVRLLPLVGAVVSSLGEVGFRREAVSFIYKYLREYESLTDNHESQNRFKPLNPKKGSKLKLDTLRFEKVNFKYPSRNDNTLIDINLEIKQGEAVGIMGSSGAGKSTLLDLVLGFLEPTSGKILINDIPLNEQLISWRLSTAYLPQEVYLIDDSIANNIALGVKEPDIDFSKVNKALEDAQLLEFVDYLPERVNTNLGESGVKISGGQRQRIALARAFYFERDTLILDEATSALDSETEKEIIDKIKYLKGSKTLIVIAHRLTTLEHCDRIYRVEKGRLTES
jgi:ABC-type multidrug transport system fused ATPase/permease subunit